MNYLNLIDKDENLSEFYSLAKVIYRNWDEALSAEPTVDLDSVRKRLRHFSVLRASQQIKSYRAVNFSLNLAIWPHLAFSIIAIVAL